MVERVPSEDIEQIVGAKRDPYLHLARAVSDTETVYILHSQDCLDRYSPDLNCHFTQALDAGIEKDHWRWFMDLPVVVVVTITDNRLRPTQTVAATQRVPRGGTGTQRDAEARKDALLAGQSTSDDLIIMDEISAFSVQVTSPPAMSIQASDGTMMLKIHADGRWEVDPENAPEAAKIFLDEVANYSERLRAEIERAERAEAAIEKTRHILTHDEPMMLGSIEQDMERNPDGEGGTVDHKPSTPGWGGTGCPGRAFVVWRDRALAALDGQDPPVPGREE